MKAFTVRTGALIKVLSDATTNLGDAQQFNTRKEHMFFSEDIEADPFGNVGDHRPGDATTAGFLLRSNHYGFKLRGDQWRAFEGQLLFVHARDVEVR